jgi:hypothetical protein
VFYSDVAQVGDYGVQPWTAFEFTAPAAGSYTIVLSAANAVDCGAPSYGLFDLQWTAFLDGDADGIADDEDACVTAPNQVVDAAGCSIADACPCQSAWKNRGAYVACTAQRSRDFVVAGAITEAERAEIVAAAAQSSCGFVK